MHHSVTDLTGTQSHFLTVLEYRGSTGEGHEKAQTIWKVRCVCGKEYDVKREIITRGRVKSCGCVRKNRTHGMSTHPAYAVYRAMIDRCRLPTHQAWKNYGARGITVDPRWSTFEAFWRDMGPSYESGLDLDRIDNDGPYSPENCRWTTRRVNSRNRRNSRIIDTPWGEMTLAEASERSGIGASTLLARLSIGVTGASLFQKADPRNRFMTS